MHGWNCKGAVPVLPRETRSLTARPGYRAKGTPISNQAPKPPPRA